MLFLPLACGKRIWFVNAHLKEAVEETMGFGACVLVWLVYALALSAAAKAADFYKDKTIRLIVGSGEGSGIDILERIVSRSPC